MAPMAPVAWFSSWETTCRSHKNLGTIQLGRGRQQYGKFCSARVSYTPCLGCFDFNTDTRTYGTRTYHTEVFLA